MRNTPFENFPRKKPDPDLAEFDKQNFDEIEQAIKALREEYVRLDISALVRERNALMEEYRALLQLFRDLPLLHEVSMEDFDSLMQQYDNLHTRVDDAQKKIEGLLDQMDTQMNQRDTILRRIQELQEGAALILQRGVQ